MKSGNLNFLEPSGPVQVCNGTALPLPLHALTIHSHPQSHADSRLHGALPPFPLYSFMLQPVDFTFKSKLKVVLNLNIMVIELFK